MDFFKKNKKPTVTDDLMAMIDEPAEPVVDHNSVLDYVVALSDDDYKKLIKVADVYRAANKKAEDILGKVTGGEHIEVRVVPKDETGFIDTEDEKLKKTKGNN